MRLIGYNLLFPLAFVLYLPWFILKLVRRGGYSRHFWERFGLFAPAQKERLKAIPEPIWIHAVSVGEVNAALLFLRRWQERDPKARFVLSTTTTTGHATAEKKLPDDVPLVYCPLDFYFPVRRALRLVRPRMLVIFEVEVWPNLIMLAARSGTPVTLVNGRMSDRSAAGYAKHAWFFRDLFGTFAAICVQTDEDAGRIRRVIGSAVPIHVCNTMKFDQTPDVSGTDKSALLDTVFGKGERLVWTAGSTHSGEEALVADAFRQLVEDFPTLKLILVPRHHERTGEVEAVLNERGLRYRLLEPGAAAAAAAGDADVLVVNTTGELMNFYAVSDVVFVGKTLAGNAGGHNIIEPAVFGKPIVHGAAMQNFRAVADVFQSQRGALQIAEDGELVGAIRGLLSDNSVRSELGQRARRVVDEWRGAIDRTLDVVEPLLRNAADGAGKTPPCPKSSCTG